MVIEHTQGRWLVNGKRTNELNVMEQRFMNEFFRNIKPEPNQELKIELKNTQQLNIQS
ncbi:hypothetical protein GFO_2488 [Christiangramia forsetii KT0803]|uniref:Uncharacterized protein n=2 Tax=Christiangramia forsetii TaxID=411153 RepID=A0M499_CHRFK|nr:hypothetical protein GFO_2488 [Christiangramia forsetii KT0803]